MPAATTSTVSLAAWGPRGYGSFGGPGGDSTSSTTSSTVDSDPATDAESVGVVLINTELAYQGATGAGTGIVLTSDGEVLTNYHVVEGATTISVTVASTGKTYDATVVGHGQTTDVALLKLSGATGLQAAEVDDDTVDIGDAVTAVGNAGGTGTLTAADGTVTDLSSTITTASEGLIASETLDGLIETDADVVPGDSGGPLVDAEGEVVGIDTAASSGGEIDGYAIPIDQAIAVVKQILAGDRSDAVQIGSTPFLGVQLTHLGYGSAVSGATVAGVADGSAAADIGLVAGDTVTAIGTTAVSDASQLSEAIAQHSSGDQVRISWTDSAGSEHTETATLGASPEA